MKTYTEYFMNYGKFLLRLEELAINGFAIVYIWSGGEGLGNIVTYHTNEPLTQKP